MNCGYNVRFSRHHHLTESAPLRSQQVRAQMKGGHGNVFWTLITSHKETIFHSMRNKVSSLMPAHCIGKQTKLLLTLTKYLIFFFSSVTSAPLTYFPYKHRDKIQLSASLWWNRVFSDLIKTKQIPYKETDCFHILIFSSCFLLTVKDFWTQLTEKKHVCFNDTWLLPECHGGVTLYFPLMFWLQHFRGKLSGRRRLSSWARSCTRPSVDVVFLLLFLLCFGGFFLSLRNMILITLSGDCWLNCWSRVHLQNVPQIHSRKKVRIWEDGKRHFWGTEGKGNVSSLWLKYSKCGL